MRFYVIETDSGEIAGCELTQKAAKERMQKLGFQTDEYTITMIDVSVNAEAVRRLLGNLGGYAN